MSAPERDIAEAIRADLAGQNFSQPITVRRLWLPVYEPTDLDTIFADVLPADPDVSRRHRSADNKRLRTEIGLVHRLGNPDAAEAASGDDTEIDGLIDLAVEIADFLRLRSYDLPAGRAAYDGLEHALYDAELLRDRRVFFSLVTITHLLLV